ncbi:MAG: hypothetical protein IIX77_04485 [Oscillospiraceae bacterium]|nr:hypothetical protein [Oscillospiraceae bacterium]
MSRKSKNKDTNTLRKSLKLLSFVAGACTAYHFSKNQVYNIGGQRAWFSFGKLVPDKQWPEDKK